MTDKKILPCPFCGEAPEVMENNADAECKIYCMSCRIAPECHCLAKDFDECVEIWNTRPPIDE